MTLHKQIASAIATGSMLLFSFTPSAFAATIELSGNGTSSDNTATVVSNPTTTVVQSNDAQVTNTVNSTASTGGNYANNNTGGDVTVATGNASSNISLSTDVNLNHADVDNCNCTTDSSVLISGNGSNSNNSALLVAGNDTQTYQYNTANISNDVYSKLSTGDNHAYGNTGGDVVLATGNADSTVSVSNAANANILHSSGGGSGGNVELRITGNGTGSDNNIDLLADNSFTAVQSNNADIYNSIGVWASTGKNFAKNNTGGEILVLTGNADSMVSVDNLANFNFADMASCGCMMDVLAKISGNGSYSNNSIFADLGGSNSIFQGEQGAGNWADLNNWVDSHSKTGYNHVNGNTGSEGDDPFLLTGDASSDTHINNSSNVNIVSSDSSGDLGWSLDFNLGDLWHMIHMS
jgi:hypothetical protein